MTARQPRRTRRRKAPADTLPRIRPDEQSRRAVEAGRAPQVESTGPREHQVTNDYRFVRAEMVYIGIVSVVAFGFIVAMSLIV